jgi:hypothetical protein
MVYKNIHYRSQNKYSVEDKPKKSNHLLLIECINKIIEPCKLQRFVFASLENENSINNGSIKSSSFIFSNREK